MNSLENLMDLSSIKVKDNKIIKGVYLDIVSLLVPIYINRKILGFTNKKEITISDVVYEEPVVIITESNLTVSLFNMLSSLCEYNKYSQYLIRINGTSYREIDNFSLIPIKFKCTKILSLIKECYVNNIYKGKKHLEEIPCGYKLICENGYGLDYIYILTTNKSTLCNVLHIMTGVNLVHCFEVCVSN